MAAEYQRVGEAETEPPSGLLVRRPFCVVLGFAALWALSVVAAVSAARSIDARKARAAARVALPLQVPPATTAKPLASPNASGRELVHYQEWPPPLTNLSRATLLALRLDRLGNAGANASAQRLHTLSEERRRSGLPPPVLVIAGGEWLFGLGNIITALASAAVLAESIGAACAFSLGEALYASELRPYLRSRASEAGLKEGAFPCADVGPSELAALRAQTSVPVVGLHDWRLRGSGTPGGSGGFILDLGYIWHEEDCRTRADLRQMIAPPGMAPGEFWARLRLKFEEFLFASVALPVSDLERRIEAGAPPWLPGTGTVCGHMRLLHKENHHVAGRASCGKGDCGGLLAALEALHVRRPFSSYLFTAGADCSHCLSTVAPRLHREATYLQSAHVSKRIAAPMDPANGTARFDDAVGAFLDMRALARCALVVVDDKPAGTFALTIAAAGRLTPCADPLAWLEGWQPGFGSVFPRVAGTYELADADDPDGVFAAPLRALCSSARASDPPIPSAAELTAEGWGRLADDVRFDLAKPWSPRQLPRLHSAYSEPFSTDECRRLTKARVRRVHKQLRRRGARTAQALRR